jgi:hypothetical protein
MWLKAVEMMENVKTEWGVFQKEPRVCELCGGETEITREKRTDVSLGIQAYEDVIRVKPSAVLFVTGDSDQVPTVAAIKRLRSDYPVFVAFPPRRSSAHLKGIVGKKNTVDLSDESWFKGCCLPDELDEYTRKPAGWA